MDVPDDASWCERPGNWGGSFDKRPSCRWGAFASGLLGATERMRCVVASFISAGTNRSWLWPDWGHTDQQPPARDRVGSRADLRAGAIGGVTTTDADGSCHEDSDSAAKVKVCRFPFETKRS